jgi:hypothetical protein
MAAPVATAKWKALGIVCPHCGNTGRRGGKWERYSSVPFKVVEDVIRSFEFTAEKDADGVVSLTVDTETDSVDWESSTNVRFECRSCYRSFELPDGYELDYV